MRRFFVAPGKTRSSSDWHIRFEQQAGWTEQVRGYLLGQLELPAQSKMLEVGCGTGVITTSLVGYAQGGVVGLDINLSHLRLAARQDRRPRYAGGDGLRMPFPTGIFDAVVCHFFLLWIAQPQAALAEMVRVVRPGGAVMAFAEPDYGGRIDYPPPLEVLGRMQAESLRSQGANPNQGRELSALFTRAGLRAVETGLLGGQWEPRTTNGTTNGGTTNGTTNRGASNNTNEERALEWAVLEEDLAGRIEPGELAALRRVDERAWESGERVLFVPTFYAVGMK
jgi:SAM-dependent methyltransferase